MTALKLVFAVALLAATGCGKPKPAASQPQSGSRLVSLAPNLTEMIWAVGGGNCLVGRTSACDIPAETLSVPVIGGYGDPSIEMLISVRPSHVLYVDLSDKSLPAQLEARGLHPRLIPCTHLDDIPAALAEVGALAGQRDRGEAMAAALSAEIAAARAAVSNAPRPRVFVELWSDPLYTVGRSSFVSELIALAGGQNIGDDVDNPYFQASPEWVIERNPEVILCLFEGDAAQTTSRVYGLPAFASLSAVRHRRVYAGFDVNLTLRPGPRVMQSVARIRKCLNQTDPPETP